MIRYNVLSVVLAVFFGGWTFYLVRRQRLGIYQTLMWVCTALGLVLAGAFPKAFDWLGHRLGVAYPPVLLIVVTLCLIVVKLLMMDIERTAHETKLRILTQRMAAYEAELSKLRERRAAPGDLDKATDNIKES
ncbi:DUF2304 domain-containing protein [Pseudodesulfovibrio sp.]|uniref:DUF2304 domain-containing protein n=1 Tax=Pseudodesulfovibrio sp. TaxID=2035812 RepID=UPI00262733B6|nr:DUF2304 domain-containing protein [Pseudodesulfovibrio sp.]MDD3313865.1 DUF2304 domain-containing protein [Pseudodesulfovibrio sp.]